MALWYNGLLAERSHPVILVVRRKAVIRGQAVLCCQYVVVFHAEETR